MSALRAARERRGLSQAELAARVDLSRQGLGAIEAGRAMPSVAVALRLARALGVTVEALFGEPSAAGEDLIATSPGRLGVARIDGRWVSWPLSADAPLAAADAIGEADGRLLPLQPPAELAQNLVLVGCATGLGLLADRLGRALEAGRARWRPATSTEALGALDRGEAHVAGVHLVDPLSGVANVADVRRLLPGRAWRLFTLAHWEVGLVARPDDPRITSLADLARPELRLVRRPPGAGAERVLARICAEQGSEPGEGLVVPGQLDVARAVRLGAADLGVASRDVALTLGLRFLPLHTERYDLVLPPHRLDDPRVRRLLDLLCSSPARRELSALGYDTTASGRLAAEITA